MNRVKQRAAPLVLLALAGCAGRDMPRQPLPPAAAAQTFVGDAPPGDAGITIIGGESAPPSIPQAAPQARPLPACVRLCICEEYTRLATA